VGLRAGNGSEPPKKEDRIQAVVDRVVEAGLSLATRTMEGASFRERLATLCVFLLFCLGIVGLIILWDSAFWRALFAIGVIVGIVVIAAMVGGWSSGRSSEGDKIRPHVRSIRILLESLRKRAHEILRLTAPELENSDVRANIFFPDADPSDTDNIKLTIYPGLHLKMELDKELGIAFRPGQGLTGDVFESGTDSVARRSSADEDEDWDEKYDITDEIAGLIHPDLKCIISFGIRDQDQKTMAVVNIDTLNYTFSNDVLYDCMYRLAPDLFTMRALIEQLVRN